MKKLILVAALALAAVALLPVASASAFTGTCEIKGEATIFSPKFVKEEPLPKGVPAPRAYRFNSSSGTCKNVPPAEKEPVFVSATVEGEGELACTISKGGIAVVGGGKGSGSITIGTTTDTFSFAFVGAGADVTFEAEGTKVKGVGGTGPAVGTATFAENPKAVVECAKEEVTKLKFTAVTEGEFS